MGNLKKVLEKFPIRSIYAKKVFHFLVSRQYKTAMVISCKIHWRRNMDIIIPLAVSAVLLILLSYIGAYIKAGAEVCYHCPCCHKDFQLGSLGVMLFSLRLRRYRLLTCPKCEYRGLMEGTPY